MKTKHKNLIYSLNILILIFFASTVLAQPPGPSMKDPEVMKQRMELHMKQIMGQLNLSAEQQELLEAHKSDHRGEAEVLRESLWTKKDELRAELEKQALDMEKVNQLNSELKDLKAKMADHRLEGILEVREILTPEQFSMFMDLKGKHKGRKGMRHGPPPCAED